MAAIAALVLVGFLALGAGPAKAEPVNFKFDRGVIDLGGEDGTWAPLIDDSIPDPPATLEAESDGDGNLSAAADKFFFPLKKIEDLDVSAVGQGVLTFVDATIKITADGPITGTYDSGTGESAITLPADVFVTVYNANSPASIAKCRVDGFNLTLNTTATALSDPGDAEADPPRPAATYEASAFDPADENKGAVIGAWASLPNAQDEGGSLGWAVCPGLDGMLGGPGGLWLSGATVSSVDKPLPTDAPRLTGTPAGSTEQTSAEFKFEAGEGETSPVTGFECKLDSGAFAACDSGTQSYTGLAVGAHKFTVRAKNQTGAGPESTYDWTITESKVCPDGTTGTPPNCVKPGKAKLGALKIQPKVKKVKRGKQAVIKVKVKNTGNAAAKGVKVCVSAPKRLVKVKKCVTLGQIAAGKVKTAKFKVKAKRKRGKATLKFKATSKNAGSKSVKATVKVK